MPFAGFDTLARLSTVAVLDGLWQGIALVALVSVLLRTTPRTSAATRYAIWWTTLLVVLALPCLRLASASPDAAPAPSSALPLHLASDWPPALFAVWILLAALMLGRLLWGYGYTRWLARTATPLDPSRQQSAARLTGSSRVPVLGSRETAVPVAVGLSRPAILIPLALLDHLTPAEFDQIVLHEWAHIRRRDNWTNCAYEFLQALFFFHPAVWFIGRSLCLERELACDDAVVAATGLPVSYAGCLARLGELHSCPPVSLSAGASGNGRDLFRRVERLLQWDGRTGFSALRFTAASVLLLAAGACSRQLPALIEVPAPALALAAPHPAIDAARQSLLAGERLRTAEILMDTAAQRLATADRMLRAARQQLDLAARMARNASPVPVSNVVCRPSDAVSQAPKLNKI